MDIAGLDAAQLDLAKKIIPTLPTEQQEEIAKLIEQVIEAQHRERCRDDFLYFVKTMWPSFVEGPHHREMARQFERIARGEQDRIAISLAPRSGKALALDTPIPTPSGWTTIGDLKPGDKIYGSSGRSVSVVAKSEVFKNRPSWRVWSDGGCSVVADYEHLWNVSLNRKKKNYKNYQTQYLATRQDDRSVDDARRPRLTDTFPIVGITTDNLPIDPYVLGIWLGDGTSANGSLTCHPDDWPHYEERIVAAGFGARKQNSPFGHGILGLMEKLRVAGLIRNKHIPPAYLRASRSARLALLQGLMDTDGSIDQKGAMEFYSTKEALIKQVRELVFTFGVRCSLREKEAKINGVSCGPTYTLAFYIPSAVSLPRKTERLRQNSRRFWGRYLSFEYAGLHDTQCIQVDAEDGIFLCGLGMMPTHNSELTSYLFPAWYLGKFPGQKVLQVSHKAELAVGFGRKVRNLISDEAYQKIFPGLTLKADNKAAGRWETNHGGTYYAAGMDAGWSGVGGDVVLIDDPLSDTDAETGAYDREIHEKIHNRYTNLRQRLQPKAKICVVSTRWSQADLIGRLIDDQKTKGADKWEVINFPAILPATDTLPERSYWPEFWSLDELKATKAAIITGGSMWKWNAAYMQNPTGEEGALIKNEWWNHWPLDCEKRFGKPRRNSEPPKCSFIIQSWDTASRATQRSNFSVCTTWGVFENDGANVPQVIMLDCWRDKLEFPELKKKALELYREWEPDCCIIEQKSAGEALISEFRRMGIYVEDFTPTRADGDKVARVNAITDIFASGVVWMIDAPWCADVLDETQAFPLGANDDIVDTISLALHRFRRGHFLILESDEDEPEVSNYIADYY